MRSRVAISITASLACILIRIGYAMPQSAPPKVTLTASEEEKSRPSKQEIVEIMTRLGKLSPDQRDAQVRAIMERKSEGTTPRSDFLFCLGSAYLGQNRAQTCVGDDYEHGKGIVDDFNDAFVWYSIALDGSVTDAKTKQSVSEARDRVKGKLVQSYPSPTDEELDALVKEQKTRIQESQKEAGKAAHK